MGEVVFDPFCGSGTTLLETESNCRIGIGLELDKEYCKLIEKRLKEAEKLGFKTCIIPESNKKNLKDTYKLDIIGVKNINEAMRIVFEK